MEIEVGAPQSPIFLMQAATPLERSSDAENRLDASVRFHCYGAALTGTTPFWEGEVVTQWVTLVTQFEGLPSRYSDEIQVVEGTDLHSRACVIGAADPFSVGKAGVAPHVGIHVDGSQQR